MDELSLSNESNHSEIVRIIQYNQYIRKLVQDQTKKFLVLKNALIETLRDPQINENPILQNSETIFDTPQIELLNQHVTSSKIQLALVGANACGKTSFLHFLLRSGNFLPADVGPVSARIIRLTYADAEDAELRVYPSLNDKQIHDKVNLKDFFSNKQEPDWDGMRLAIKDHVTRPDPDIIKSNSNVFAEWAKFFIEIRIPSSFLKLGIDVYDTPGLLFSDALILKENLCQLITLVKPTLVFMYDNPGINSDTNDCFLALKHALGPLADISMFFLNTKADIDRILADADPNEQGIDDEKIPEILSDERQKRYQLLLNVPSMANEVPGGLPKSLLECSCFDIISVHSDFDALAAQLNRTTINRLVQFTANSDLKIATKVSRLVLPMIDAFFDLTLTANHRTTQQFQLILAEAKQWTENFYDRYRNLSEQIFIELYNAIVEQLYAALDNIAERASRFESSSLIGNYIKTAVQQEIIKVEIEKIRKRYTDITVLDQFTDPCLVKIAEKNEFLIIAQRNSNWFFEFPKKNFNNKLTRETFTKETILAQLLLITDVLIESNEGKKQATSLSNYKQLFSRKTSLGKDISPLDFARELLLEFSSWLDGQKTYISEIMDGGFQVEKTQLLKKINQFYDLAIQSTSHREKIYRHINKYSKDFALIQCKIIAALNLAKFNGKIPIVDESQTLDEDVYLAKWFDQNEFLAKRTLDSLEVHYHLQVTQLRVPNILPLLYLYEDERTDHMWMFFRKYPRKLKDTNLTVDNLFEISFDIANTLAYLHSNEIIHGNIHIENIFLDENNQCYLTNFHFNKQHQLGINVDISAFGRLSQFLYENIIKNNVDISEEDLQNIKDFKILFSKCLISDVKAAAVIVHQLKKIRKNL